jgi:hypothetical protein
VQGEIFPFPGLPPNTVQVFIGPNSLTPKQPTIPLAAGEFEVTSATQLRFLLPPDTNSGEVLFRVVVNGAESAPNWVTVP